MARHVREAGVLGTAGAITLAMGLLWGSVQGPALARGEADEDRSAFYGLIESRPGPGRQGVWVIGGRAVEADGATEFDETEGPLEVGRCAKVDVRNGRVHEIDSEPMGDCR